MTASVVPNFSVSARIIGKAKTDVSNIPVKKKPNSTAGPDFWEENRLPSEEEKVDASIIGNGLNNMNGNIKLNHNFSITHYWGKERTKN